ncbi:MAG: Mur ligase family protein [Patescibacteria group bacterium]
MKEEILLLLTFLFWFLHIAKRLLSSLYFWQLKEYRIGRVSQDINKKRIIFPKSAFLALIFIFLSFIFDGIIPIIYFVFILYFVLGILAGYQAIKNNWHFPLFTVKMLLLFGINLFLLLGFIMYFYKYVFFLLIFEIIFFVFVSISIILIQFPTFFIKKLIQYKAKKKIEKFKDLTVIGITGSFGKSSTKEFLYSILSTEYNVLKTEGNVNTEIGIANTVLKKLKPSHEIFICEMGAYKRGEIREICNIVKPKIGILTEIGQQHIGLFGSMDNIVKAKFELIDSLPEDGVAILNWDNSFIKKNYVFKENTIKYSVNRKANIFSKNVKVEKDKLSFEVFSSDKNSAKFELNVLGKHNIPNILAALSCVKLFGINLKKASSILKKGKIKNPMELKRGLNKTNIIDASYSANPKGVIAHLEYLKSWKKKRIIVMPCLIELGNRAKEEHEILGKKIGEVCDLAIITTPDYFEDLKKGVFKMGMKNENILFMQDADLIFNKIKDYNNAEDVILFESRVPEKLKKLFLK